MSETCQCSRDPCRDPALSGPGPLLTEVTPGGQSEALGLRLGDVQETYGGQEVVNTSQFIRGRSGEPPGGRRKA